MEGHLAQGFVLAIEDHRHTGSAILESDQVLWKVLEGSRKVRKKPPRKVESTWDSTSMPTLVGEESQVDSQGATPPWKVEFPPLVGGKVSHHMEAKLRDFYTDTTPSSVGFKRSYCPLEREVDVVFINNRTCDRVRCCPFVAPEPIVIKIFYALLQAASERLPQQQEPPLVGFGISSRLYDEEGSSIGEHMLVMTGHAKKLSDLGIVIPNRLGINRVLQSLPPSYKNFVMNYNMQNMNKEFPELFGMLKAAEIEIKKEHQVLMVNKTTASRNRASLKARTRRVARKRHASVK
ncbi:hypothetical protein QYE76_015364 [Lolium multiflorum]|uniref:Uncharacterized protein n=1 Tax=Lolium multiflorum TaxID=4521 RepID=A0AAD8U6U2_LOLMU|nr:hypothetical protein QYE76_015364 [Lolium multiflorum]